MALNILLPPSPAWNFYLTSGCVFTFPIHILNTHLTFHPVLQLGSITAGLSKCLLVLHGPGYYHTDQKATVSVFGQLSFTPILPIVLAQ